MTTARLVSSPRPPGVRADWVFAYGSNMHLEDLGRFIAAHNLPAGELYEVEVAALPGYELVWNYFSRARSGGAANVARLGAQPLESRPAISSFAAARLFGVALLVCPDLLRALDRKEGHPGRYRRERCKIVLRSGRAHEAWVYRVLPEFESAAETAPTRAYRDLMLEAAVRHHLPSPYVAAIRDVRTRD